MLPKKNRADKKSIEKVFRKDNSMGKFLNSPTLNLKFFIDPESKSKNISVIVPKSVGKSAVLRNRIRRRGYTLLREHLNLLPIGVVGALIFKKNTTETETLSDEIRNIFNKIN